MTDEELKAEAVRLEADLASGKTVLVQGTDYTFLTGPFSPLGPELEAYLQSLADERSRSAEPMPHPKR